jgi:hypothetical protein
MTEKRSWADGEASPWAGQPDPPTVWEVALAYPGRAIRHALFAAIFGLFASAFIVWAFALAAHVLLRLPPLPSVMPVFVVWAFVSAGLWWADMYSDIRGWSTFTSD